MFAEGMIRRGESLHRRLQIGMPFQRTPVHRRLFAGFLDQPKVSNIQKSEWPDLLDLIPANQVHPVLIEFFLRPVVMRLLGFNVVREFLVIEWQSRAMRLRTKLIDVLMAIR